MTNTLISAASKIMLGSTEATKMYIGSTLIWLTQASPAGGLPQGYTELEYISSTASGSQYIDLGLKLYEVRNTEYDIAIKFNMTGVGSDNQTQATFFSTAHSASPYAGLFIRKTNNNVNGRYVGVNSSNAKIGTIGTIIELPTPEEGGKNVYALKNENGTWSTPTTLFCAMNYSDSTWSPYRYAAGNLYYFKIWVNGVLTRDLVPCKNANDTIGLYDLVNKTFYTSPNGAAFVAGPEV